MKNTAKLLLFILLISVACSHQQKQSRAVASGPRQQCLDSVKAEYQSYFDSVEKCIEKEPIK